ncbi:hypothetical protein FWC31_00505 [Candidatus Saccharibacteria bacterium]|nr:hypothetical protein [Candidatus Saccharibacteria bacterium]
MPRHNQLPFYEPLEDGPIAIAHRCNSIETAQNVAQILKSYGLPLYGEVDVIASDDDVLMACHGATFPVDTHGRPQITTRELQRMTADEIGRLDIENAKLDELLSAIPGMRYFVHVKTERAAELLPELLTCTGSFERVCVGAMTQRAALQLFAENVEQPNAMTMDLWSSVPIFLNYLRALASVRPTKASSIVQATQVHFHDASSRGYDVNGWIAHQAITPPMVRFLNNCLGVPVFTHITHPHDPSEKQVQKHLNKGLDGIMGDGPGLETIARVVSQRRQELRQSDSGI